MQKRRRFSLTLRGAVVALCLFSPGLLRAQGNPAPAASDPHQQALERWQKMRFGMFIHWGPVSIKGTEIGWSRGGQIPREEYDNLYKQFNPVRFNADEWARVAKDAGMKYMILTSKHHDGFCLWDTKQTDHNIMNSPFGRDVVKELAAACKKEGIAFGLYYSILDWYQPDYNTTKNQGGAGYALPEGQKPDMDRYNTHLKAQLRELAENYGPLLMFWFDGQWEDPWTFERGEDLYKYCMSLQNNIIVNNRVSKYQKADPAKGTPAKGHPGDYDTPEQQIGSFQNTRPWETCMTICQQWAWKPNDNMKSFAQCIQTLVRTAGGDGNLLFNVGPMPDGRIEPRQVERLREMGDWLKKYGETVYDTRGGPFYPDKWGCSTHRGDKVYVHVMQWSGAELLLPALEQKIASARALTGGNATFKQEEGAIRLYLPESNRDAADSIIELQLAGPVKGMAKSKRAPTAFDRGDYGKWISKDATYEASSIESQWSHDEKRLLSGEEYEGGFCFHTKEEANPSIVIALGRTAVVKGIEIVNRKDMLQDKARTITVWVSKDKKEWTQVWKAAKTQDMWEVPVTEFVAGIQQAGVAARYIKIGLQEKNYLHLYSVKVYGDAE